jgi:hypothetical protein
MNKSLYYYFYAAAAATGIAGILHLMFFLNGLSRGGGINNIGIFFLVTAVVQLFWVIPMIRRWGKTWYYIGIGGTVVLIILWAITRVPNPITNGRAIPINSMSIATELFEFAFIIITAIIVVRQGRLAPKEKEQLR